MSQFNPKRVLRQLSPKLLKELFDRQPEQIEVSWGDGTRIDIDDVFHAWQRMSDGPRKAIEVLFHDIDDMATGEDGVLVILEEGTSSGEDFVSAFEPMESRFDRCLWTYLHHPRIWNTAVRFAEADGLATGRYWVKRSDVPKEVPKTDEAGRQALATAMSAFYRDQGRGHNCTVDHLIRAQTQDYFFVYLSDYANTHVNFDESGNLHRDTERRAFEVVFAYDRSAGALETFAKGGKKVIEPIQRIFCSVVLGCPLKPDTSGKAPYGLDGLLNRSFPFVTDPEDEIEAVSVRGLRLSVIGRKRGRITLEADPQKGPTSIYDMLDEDLNKEHLPLSVLQVTKVTLNISRNVPGRGGSFTFSVALPNSCDLKSKREELRLMGEKYLKRWKIDVA